MLNMLNNRTLGLTVLVGLLFAGSASAETTPLSEKDMVAVSFWIATAMMFASTIFFLVERNNVAPKWRTSMTVAALVTGVAWYHYTYMRDHWVATGESPLVLRYIDWLITVPLQVAEFYLILAAIGVASAALFWRLFGASIIMLVFGFLGESGHRSSMRRRRSCVFENLFLTSFVAARSLLFILLWRIDGEPTALHCHA